MNGTTLKLAMHGKVGEQAYTLEITPEQAKEIVDVLNRATCLLPEKDFRAIGMVHQIIHSVLNGWIDGMQKH